jgi:hypothetical protein
MKLIEMIDLDHVKDEEAELFESIIIAPYSPLSLPNTLDLIYKTEKTMIFILLARLY